MNADKTQIKDLYLRSSAAVIISGAQGCQCGAVAALRAKSL
jgi:hypothetical protein